MMIKVAVVAVTVLALFSWFFHDIGWKQGLADGFRCSRDSKLCPPGF